MARPAKITKDDILDAAAQSAFTHRGSARVKDVAERLGVPVGSIFYRYPSREELFVSLWLRAIRRFHVGLLEASQVEDADAALLACALHTPRFCRRHPADAVAMTLYRQPDLAGSAPEGLREEVEHVNDAVTAAMHQLTVRRYGADDPRHVTLVTISCQESPYGLVHRYLRTTTPVPHELDAVVTASTAAILALGD